MKLKSFSVSIFFSLYLSIKKIFSLCPFSSISRLSPRSSYTTHRQRGIRSLIAFLFSFLYLSLYPCLSHHQDQAYDYWGKYPCLYISEVLFKLLQTYFKSFPFLNILSHLKAIKARLASPARLGHDALSDKDPAFLFPLYTPGAAASIDADESELSCHSHSHSLGFHEPEYYPSGTASTMLMSSS